MATSAIDTTITLGPGIHTIRFESVSGSFTLSPLSVTLPPADAAFAAAAGFAADATQVQQAAATLAAVAGFRGDASTGLLGSTTLAAAQSIVGDAVAAHLGALLLNGQQAFAGDASYAVPGSWQGALALPAVAGFSGDAAVAEGVSLAVAAALAQRSDAIWATALGVQRLVRNPRAGLSWIAGPRQREPQVAVWFADRQEAALLTVTSDAQAADAAMVTLAATLGVTPDATADEVAAAIFVARLGIAPDASVADHAEAALAMSAGLFVDADYVFWAADWVAVNMTGRFASDGAYSGVGRDALRILLYDRTAHVALFDRSPRVAMSDGGPSVAFYDRSDGS